MIEFEADYSRELPSANFGDEFRGDLGEGPDLRNTQGWRILALQVDELAQRKKFDQFHRFQDRDDGQLRQLPPS